MRLLLLGGSGQLGTAIRRTWSDCDIVAPDRGAVDLEDAQALASAIASHSPEIVANCAAFHDVDRCESEPAKAFEINAYAVFRLARLCRDAGATFVTFSTDYVFDGSARRPYREEDAPSPLSAYAASKLAGEALALCANDRTYVVRTCGLYGIASKRAKPSFIDRMIETAERGEPVTIDPTTIASPTFAEHLAVALRQLIESKRYGLYHAANLGPVSWFDFAAEALRQAGIGASPVPAPPPKRVAPRPAYSALENARLAALHIVMPGWQAGIRDYLACRKSVAARQ